MIKIIEPSVRILANIHDNSLLKRIESYGRTCYKSESKITKDSAEQFIKGILDRGHLSVIEHEKITARVICDRGVTHEIVRHRIASYSQESTRYVNYNKKGIEFIKPCFWKEDDVKYKLWLETCYKCAEAYNTLITLGATPQEARSVLPNSLKTEIVITYNLREWIHFFTLRCDKTAHPQMQQIAKMLLVEIRKYIPIIFDDLYKKFIEENVDASHS